MAKRVVVIASGETERLALPNLLRGLTKEGIKVDVLKPPRSHQLTFDMAKRLIKSEWFRDPDSPPDKFVVLLDTDGRPVDEVTRPFGRISEEMPNVRASILISVANRHLEAWFFADAQALRDYLGRNLGKIDASKPEEIENPKLYLSNLLSKTYAPRISAEIAGSISADVVRRRSHSFCTFEDAVRNGAMAAGTAGR